MVKPNFKQDAILENLDGLFESGYDPSNITINAPFNKYFRVATLQDMNELEDIETEEQLEEYIEGDECNDACPIIGYAVAKDEYREQLEFDGLFFMAVGEDGNLYYNVADKVDSLEPDEVLNAIGEISEDDTIRLKRYN